MINEKDFTVDISSPNFLGDRIIKKVTHVPSGKRVIAMGNIAECNQHIREWLKQLEKELDNVKD